MATMNHLLQVLTILMLDAAERKNRRKESLKRHQTETIQTQADQKVLVAQEVQVDLAAQEVQTDQMIQTDQIIESPDVAQMAVDPEDLADQEVLVVQEVLAVQEVKDQNAPFVVVGMVQ